MAFATKKKCEELLQYFTTMIDNRRKELQKGEQTTQSVIDVMLTSPSNFTEDEVGDPLFTNFRIRTDVSFTAYRQHR
jgi:cytochrome P450